MGYDRGDETLKNFLKQIEASILKIFLLPIRLH